MGNVTEEELTLTFDDGDSDVEERKTTPQSPRSQPAQSPPETHLIYKEYVGEDFSKYLQDDTDDIIQQQQVHTEKRYRKRRGSRGDTLEPDIVTVPRKPGIKEKISKVFTLSRPAKNRPGGRMASNIHNFSYVDSKNYDMGSELGIMDTCSDIGGIRQDTWWGKDTLSARTLRTQSDIGAPRYNPSRSEPNLAQYGSTGSEKSLKKKKGLWNMFTNKRNKKNTGNLPPSRDDLDGVKTLTRKQQSCEDIRL